MKKFFTVMAAAMTASVFALSGCGDGENNMKMVRERYYGVMNTDAELVIFDDFDTDKTALERWESLVDEVGYLLYDIDASLSATASKSCISQFNAAEAGAWVQIDNYTYDVLSIALSVYEKTGGSYNPAIYYGVQAFGFNGSKTRPAKEDELPSTEVTDAYADLASHFGELRLKPEEGKFYAVKPEYTVTVEGVTLSMKIDLGGIAKGYAVDLVDEIISEYGYEYGYVNFGDSSAALKKHPSGNYNMSFRDPRSPYSAYCAMPLADVKLSTSGDYENYYEIGGKRYCHIFDPFTARPVDTGIMTASVMGGSAAEDDALTTALMVMGADEAIRFIAEELPDRQVVFTCEINGAYYYYTNITEGFTALNDAYAPYAAN